MGCALPKSTGGPAPGPVAIKAAPVAQNLGMLVGTVQGPSASLIANNSAGFRLLGGAAPLEPVAGGHVEVVNAVDVPVNPATTLLAKKLQESLRQRALDASSLEPAGLAQAAEELAVVMSERAIVAAAILDPAQTAVAFDAIGVRHAVRHAWHPEGLDRLDPGR